MRILLVVSVVLAAVCVIMLGGMAAAEAERAAMLVVSAALALLVLSALFTGLLDARARQCRTVGVLHREQRRQVVAALRRGAAPDDAGLDAAVLTLLDRQRVMRRRTDQFLRILRRWACCGAWCWWWQARSPAG